MQPGNTYIRLLPPGEAIHTENLRQFAQRDECGAVVLFEGVVRETEDSRKLEALDYDHHEVMAETELRRIVEDIAASHEIQTIACEHRLGVVPVREASVCIVVGASHRKAAFAACETIMDRIKKTVPIWKKAVYHKSS